MHATTISEFRTMTVIETLRRSTYNSRNQSKRHNHQEVISRKEERENNGRQKYKSRKLRIEWCGITLEKRN